MGLNTAASGFGIILLSLSVVQGQTDWPVTYTSPSQICAIKGSTVDISCTYTYPAKINEKKTKLEQRFWFVKESNNVQTGVKTDPDYRGRVKYRHHQKNSTLRISNLRESDSAEYKFRFITNQPRGMFTGSPGVTLTVTGLQVQVIKPVLNSGQRAELKCLSSCLPDHRSYVWFRNGKKISSSSTFLTPVHSTDRYSCSLKGYKKSSSPSVYAPRLPSVSVSPSGEVVEGSSVTLTCSSDANPAANYTWNKRNGHKLLSNNSELFFSSIQPFDSGEYQCTAVNDLGKNRSEYKLIDVKYPPRLPSVSVSPSGEVVEGSSVILNCSSDANPAPNYTWSKRNDHKLISNNSKLFFSSIQPFDHEEYQCTAVNDLGKNRSEYKLIDVKYPPRLPSVSVSPSGEVVEGISVTLTCNSDANPAPNYTWSKRNDHKLLSNNSKLFFSSIQPFDYGEYQCTAVNDLGKNRSEYTLIDVKYSPRLSSVSVSPSGEVVEGSSVTLTCSSDANPEANYTWYKENEDSPKASEQIFIITDSRPEHSGNYYCEAQNIRGRHNSTLHLTVFAGNGKYTAAGVTAVILLILIFLSVFLWTRRKSNKSDESDENVDNREQTLPDMGQPKQDNLQYSSIVFFNKEPDSLYSNIRVTRPHRKMEEQEVTEYAAVSFNTTPIYQETGENPFELYSTVNKT